MYEMENVNVMHGRCVGPGMNGKYVRISNTNLYRVLKFLACCHLFPVFVSVPICSCMSHFVLCHICTHV